MAKVDVLDILMSRHKTPQEFHFENLIIPPMHYYLSYEDIEALRKIATSARLSSKINVKYSMIDNIMRNRGFKRFSAGTNRVVYRFTEDDRFLVKIAVDKVGMQDNPLEFKNQFLLQPYVTKMFYISQCGTVGFCERVLPIKNKAEFKEIASDVFDIIVNKILGLFVVEDIGTKYFMNWGIRAGFGPVLLDYPYVYKLDGSKLFCSLKDDATGTTCDGEIDYDVGFNHLVCSKCGKIYLATNLRDDNDSNNIVIKKGGRKMHIVIKKGDFVIAESIPSDNVMTRPKRIEKPNGRKVKITKGDNVLFEDGTRNNVEVEPISADTKPIIEVPSSWTNDDTSDNREKVEEFVDGIDPASKFIPTDDTEEASDEEEDDFEDVYDKEIDEYISDDESSSNSEEQDVEEDESEEDDDYKPDPIFNKPIKQNDFRALRQEDEHYTEGKGGKRDKRHKKNRNNMRVIR